MKTPGSLALPGVFAFLAMARFGPGPAVVMFSSPMFTVD